MKKLLFLLVISLGFVPNLAQAAKVYVWTDKDGNKVYSQHPPPDKSVQHKKKIYKTGDITSTSSGSGEPACQRELRNKQRVINNRYRLATRRCNTWVGSSRSHVSQWRSDCLYKARNERSVQMRALYHERRECRRRISARKRATDKRYRSSRRKTCREKADDLRKKIESRRRRQEERCAAERDRSGNNVSYGFCVSHARRKYNYSMSKYIDYVGSGCRSSRR